MIISIKIRENITHKKKTVSIIYDTAPFVFLDIPEYFIFLLQHLYLPYITQFSFFAIY